MKGGDRWRHDNPPSVRAELTASDLDGVLKPIDSAWTVLVIDPIAQRLLPWVYRRRWMTPMRLTVAATVLGLLSAGLFSREWSVAGAIVFEFRFLIDCLDGRLARLRGVSSAAGAAADRYGDRVVMVAVFAAVSWAGDLPWLGLVACVGYVAYFVSKDRRDERLAAVGGTSTAERLGSQGVGRRLRTRRIYPLVTSVDVEHTAFFVVPLAAAATALELQMPALGVVAVYFVANAVRFGIGITRMAAAPGGPTVEPRG